MEERIQQAVANFKAGYNCSQAVVLAFADLYHLNPTLAAQIATPFGGGIGRMRETCGAACGMFLLTGLEKGTTDPTDTTGKNANYTLVQDLAEQFKVQNRGIICAELRGLRKALNTDESVEKSPQRPSCVQLVESAARIYAQHLEKVKNQAETQA